MSGSTGAASSPPASRRASPSLRSPCSGRRSKIWTPWSPGARNPRANTGKLGITGFCRGGRMVWMYGAHQKKMDAGVAWYGGLGATPPAMTRTPLDIVDQLNAPVLGLYGGADQGIPLEQVEKLREALKKSRSPQARQSGNHGFEGMPHGFNADYRPSYRKEAAADGWKRMLAWFKRNGVA